MNRRQVLQAAASLSALPLTLAGRAISRSLDRQPDRIMTVRGSMSADAIGFALVHEHVLVDFIGAAGAVPNRYDRVEVSRIVLPHLEKIRDLGVTTLFECTPAYLARDAELLRDLSDRSGVTLITNTGYYAANGGKHLPGHAHTDTVDELAARWIHEWNHGIDESNVRPGFIKIGVDAGPLNKVARKLVLAAARVHKATGLTIAAHTPDAIAAREEVKLLEGEGVTPDAWIWVHAQSVREVDVHAELAGRGAWIEFDGISPGSIDEHVRLVVAMKKSGLLNRVLLSHDAGWYHVGEPGGGEFRPYDTLVREFLPALRGAGFSQEELRSLTATNPREAFRIRTRINA